MKKCYKLLLVIAMALYMPFSAFVNVKADADLISAASGDIAIGNDVIGHYESYNYVADAQTDQIYVDVEGLNTLSYTGGSLHVIGFNEKYSGTISITLVNMQYATIVLVQGDDIGSYNLDVNNRKVYVDLVSCSSFKIYSFSTASSLSNRTTGITGYDTSGLVVSGDISSLADYMVPTEALTAYAFTSTDPLIHYDDGDIYPYINVSNGTYGRLTSWNIASTGTVSYVFMSSVNLSQSSIVLKNNNINFTLASVSPYSFSGGYRIYKVDFTGKGTSLSAVNDQIQWKTTTKIYPIYFGTTAMMPENVKRICSMITIDMNIERDVDSIESYVALIYDLLNRGQDPSDEEFISDMGDIIGDYSDSEVVIHDFFDDSFSGIDLTDYSLPASLAATTQWVVSQMETIFYNAPDLRILMTLPLVLGIALFFIGRGSVIFRQGNIDRARAVAYGDQISAEAAKEKIDEDRIAGIHSKIQNNDYRMQQHGTGHLGYHDKAVKDYFGSSEK